MANQKFWAWVFNKADAVKEKALSEGKSELEARLEQQRFLERFNPRVV